MGTNEGGRATQDATDILERTELGQPRPHFSPRPPYAGPAPEATKALRADVDMLYDEATGLEAATAKGDPEPSSKLIAAYNRVLRALETPAIELPDDVAASISFAANALAHAAAKHRRREIKVLAAGLATRLQKLGFQTQDPLVDLLGREQESSRAERALHAASDRIDALTGQLDAAPRMAVAAIIAHSAPVVATLLREATNIEQANDALRSQAKPFIVRLDALVAVCRVRSVDLESSRLDLILRGATDVLEALGSDRKDYLADYYGRRTIAGMTGSHAPGSESLGEDHVNDILDWLRNGSVTAMLYSDLRAIVTEPQVKKEPSFFESLLQDAIVAALSLGPSIVMKALVGSVLKAAPPREALSAGQPSTEVSVDDIYGLQAGRDLPGPGPALSAGEAGGLRQIGESALPLVSGPITGQVNAKIKAGVKAGLAHGNKAPLSTTFIDQLREGAIADMGARFAEAHELKRSLAMIPPAQVQEMFQQMQARAAAEAIARRADLVMQWADFVVKATSGLDAAGTVNQFGGDLATMGDLPGTVKIPVTVTMLTKRPFDNLVNPAGNFEGPASFRWGAVHMSGMSGGALEALRAAKVPMGSAKLHRVYNLTVIDEGGRLHEGRIDVNPDGVVDASGAPLDLLAKIGKANPGVWALAPTIVGADEPNAQEGVRQILSMGNLTTAEIH